MAEQLTKQEKSKKLSPYILIQGYRNTITIGKDIIRLLGFPEYICFRINETNNSIILFPCASEDVMSFKVPEKLLFDHHCVFRIHSKKFVHGVVSNNNLDNNIVYSFGGVYLEGQNVILVNLSAENCRIVTKTE